jgi:hypothetical protein
MSNRPADTPTEESVAAERGSLGLLVSEHLGTVIVAVPLVLSSLAIGIMRPAYVEYVSTFGLSVADVDIPITDAATTLLSAIGVLVVILLGGVATARLLYLAAIRTATKLEGRKRWQTTVLAASLLVIVLLEFAFVFSGWDYVWMTGSLMLGGLGWLAGLFELAMPQSRVLYPVAALLALFLLWVIAAGQWADAGRSADALLRGLPHKHYEGLVRLELPVATVLLSPIDAGDPLELCEGEASGVLIARGRGHAYVIVRPAALEPGAIAPVVPVPEGKYIVFSVSEAMDAATQSLCASPLMVSKS